MGPYTFRVTTDPDVIAAASSEGRDAAGFSTLTASIIGIDVAPPRSHAFCADTLLHELIHMALAVSGWQAPDEDAEERIVLAISTNLLGCLRDNPEVISYLTHKE